MGEFPSGQRGQTVNLLRFASMVRIRPPPPRKPLSERMAVFVVGEDGFEHFNATVRWTVARSRLDGIDTLLVIPETE